MDSDPAPTGSKSSLWIVFQLQPDECPPDRNPALSVLGGEIRLELDVNPGFFLQCSQFLKLYIYQIDFNTVEVISVFTLNIWMQNKILDKF